MLCCEICNDIPRIAFEFANPNHAAATVCVAARAAARGSEINDTRMNCAMKIQKIIIWMTCIVVAPILGVVLALCSCDFGCVY